MKKDEIKNGAKTLGNILLAGIAIAGISGVAIIAPNAIQLIKNILPEDDIKRHYKYRANSSLKKLIKDGYIIEKIINNKKSLSLTTKGKLKYESLKEKTHKRWDGKWRLISFDVYEKNRNKRNLLRKELQAYGFQMVHQSMWAYPYHCDEYIALLKSDLSFGKNVQYMLAEYLDMHMELKRMFDL
jgi:DNA-binding transcriptional regulator PaaX